MALHLFQEMMNMRLASVQWLPLFLNEPQYMLNVEGKHLLFEKNRLLDHLRPRRIHPLLFNSLEMALPEQKRREPTSEDQPCDVVDHLEVVATGVEVQQDALA